jgi:hypothetical protein
LLPNGNVLVAGGFSGGTLASVEVFDRLARTWTTVSAMNTNCNRHTATMLPNGTVLVVGGQDNLGFSLTLKEVFDPAVGSWSPTGPLNTARYSGGSTLLPDGRMLYVGGFSSVTGFLTNAEVYNAANKTWTSVPGLKNSRDILTATLLLDGKVLVVGGFGGPGFVSESEVYDPVAETWTVSGELHSVRLSHTATLLPNGKVLIAGGEGSLVNATDSVELYDPGSGSFTTISPMNVARENHTATLLNNGKVLVAAGFGRSGPTNSCELYDPITGVWSITDPLPFASYGHTATLLPNGKVLVAGGQSALGITASAAVFDPASGPNGKWTTVGSMNVARRIHSALLLPNGKVLVAGGQAEDLLTLSSAELFDPVTAKWTLTAPMSTARVDGRTELLPDGRVLVTGGQDTNFNVTAASELYDVGQGFATNSRPEIATISSPLNLGSSLVLTGSKFRGVSEGSGGNGAQGSPGDCPVVQLRSIVSERVLNLSSTNWQSDSYISLPVTNFPSGWALATVFVNGIPSTSGILLVTPPEATTIFLANPTRLGNGSIQFAFTNTPGAVFTAFATTNVAAPLNYWIMLSSPVEIAPGQFRVIDSASANFPRRFYRVRSP